MAWRQITFRMVTGNPFGLDNNRYGLRYKMEVSLDDGLTTEQFIQALIAEQFINTSDTPQFAFRLVPVSRSLSFDPAHKSRVLDFSEDLSQEQLKELMKLWQDEEEHYIRSPNPPLKPGRRLGEAHATHPYEPILFVEGIRREFLRHWKQRPPSRGRWGDTIGWYEPLPLSDSEQAALKQRFQVLSFTPALENENAPLSESGIRGIPLDSVEIIAMLGSIASVVQVMLMVVDMWSRKAKGKAASKAKQGVKHAWDEVKEIRVMMSDGTSIQFESWMEEPEKVKSFIETFHLPSQSPKPMWVTFLLKNGKQVLLSVSESGTNQQELETFINYLKL